MTAHPRGSGRPSQGEDPAEWARARLLPRHLRRSPWLSHILGWVALVSLGGLLASALPPEIFIPGSTSFILIIGVIGVWRYSWAFLHFCRAVWYKSAVFPRLRERADSLNQKPSHLYFVVLSFRMGAHVNAAVYGRLLEEVREMGVGATIMACITDPADGAVIEAQMTRLQPGEHVRVFTLPQRGKGKRDAMGEALRLIAEDQPSALAQVVLMDGDTMLGTHSLDRACSILAADRRVGAVTTENLPFVEGTLVEREWYRLRMAQRSMLMNSMSLSRRVLVLTGRFSVFKAEVATRHDFILAVEEDIAVHWRLGTLPMVTGDDKSTWYNVLSRGWDMLYVPDAVVHPIEEIPGDWFVPSSVALMARWFGNMIRNNGRALRLGPRQTGWFPWIALLDQRVSMWTTMVGPTFALLAALLSTPVFLVIYLFWVLATRTVHSLLLSAVTGRMHPLFPFLLYYQQFVGSLVKIWTTFHPYRQSWTRQAVKTGSGPSAAASLHAIGSNLMALAMATLFVLFVAWASDVMTMSDRRVVDPTTIGPLMIGE